MISDKINKLISSQNFSIAVALVIAAALIINTVKAIDTNYDLQLEVGTLEQEIAVLELENANLELEKQYYDTDAFIEYEARRRLNKYAPGEKRVVLPKYEFPPIESVAEPAARETGFLANIDSWWSFFLSSDTATE